MLEGAENIRDLESQHQLTLPRDGGFETLAGFMLSRLQRIPKLHESFEYEGHRFTVEEMEGHRIAKVKVEKLEESNVEPPGGLAPRIDQVLICCATSLFVCCTRCRWSGWWSRWCSC